MLEVFNKAGCEIPSRDIEACHCLTNSNDRIIVKFFAKERLRSDHVSEEGPLQSQSGRCWVKRE